MLTYEQSLWDSGYHLIAGIDEVGRGCLFGDVVAAAVIMPRDTLIDGIRDSKKLTASKRELLFETIYREALSVAVGVVDVETIEMINIKQASRLAMKRAVEQLRIQPDSLLIDAEQLDTSLPQHSIIRGDSLSHSIAAASIIAKVTRDRMCEHWHTQYPNYGILQHKGYGTLYHMDCIRKFGITPLHRKLFVRNLISS
jgi:ribonuclease HII